MAGVAIRPRRARLIGCLAAIVAAVCLLPVTGWAQQAVRVVIPFTAGGSLDALGRLLAQHMAEGLRQPVVVENRPGASGLIAVRSVLQAPPDGRSLLMGSSFLASGVALNELDFDPRQALQPVIKLTLSENFLAVPNGLGASTLAELKRLSQQRPGGLNCAGVAGQMMLSCERLRLLLDGNLVTIPYPGVQPALTALVSGQVDVMFAPRAALVPLLAGQRLRVLASATAAAAAPPYEHLPLLKDTWPGMVMTTSHGLYVAAGTPAHLVAGLNRELNRVLALPTVRSTMQEAGYVVVGGPPEVLAQTLAHDIEFYQRIVSDIGLKPAR